MFLLWLASALAWTPIAPGVDRDQWLEPGPNRVSAVRINLCHPGVSMRATTQSERGARTSSWAQARGVAAAVNGGFFVSGYRSDGAAAGNGTRWTDAADQVYRGWVGFGPRNIGHWGSGSVTWPGPSWVDEAVNGDATLVLNGTAVNCGGCGGNARNPRTAVGYTADRRTLYLVTVDGRSSSSRGMTIDELAVRMAAFGVDRAMNLDGGGSTTMWNSAQGVVNVPSDGSERTVANHLGVYADGSSLAEHCPTGWAAEYLGSTFPGGTNITAEVGSRVTGTLTFRNDGTETWDTSNTRLAPLPRDTPSVLQAPGWIAGTRITPPDAPTPPGATGSFTFDIEVPDSPGTTVMEFSMVQEFVSWFGSSWGPPDGTLTLTVNAVPAPGVRAENLGLQGFPAQPWNLEPGETIAGSLRVRNTGTSTWPSTLVRVGTSNPRDHLGVFYDAATWSGQGRASQTSRSVPPGDTFDFPITFRAPTAEGSYSESFGLVWDGVIWFGDAGGPADGFLSVSMDVEIADSDGDGLRDDDEINTHGTDPNLADTDGDGLDDSIEVVGPTDPLLADTDGDGLDDGTEVAGPTDPLLADTDNDGLLDGDELAAGTDPVIDDSDGDGLLDGEELALGTSPTLVDSDLDGLDDNEEVFLYGTDPTTPEPFSVLPPLDWLAGEDGTLRIVGADANANVYVLASGRLGSFPIPFCGNSTGLRAPSLLGIVSTDAAGSGSLTLTSPGLVAGRTGFFVGATLTGCVVSDMTQHAFP